MLVLNLTGSGLPHRPWSFPGKGSQSSLRVFTVAENMRVFDKTVLKVQH